MAELFAFLFLIILIVTCVFMAKPNLSQFKNRPALTRKQIAIYGFGSSLVCFALIGVFAPAVPKSAVVEDSTPKNNAPKVEPKAENVEPVAEIVQAELVKKQANLGMTAEQFRKNFNAELKKLDIDSLRPLGEFDIKTNEFRDSFIVQITDDIGMTGFINKDGQLSELLLIMGSSNAKTGTQMLLLSGITSNVINKNDKKVAADILVDLMMKAMNGIEKPENTHEKMVNGIKYYSLASPEMGLWVGFTAKENK